MTALDPHSSPLGSKDDLPSTEHLDDRVYVLGRHRVKVVRTTRGSESSKQKHFVSGVAWCNCEAGWSSPKHTSHDALVGSIWDHAT